MASVIDGRESGFKTNPDYKVILERSPRRVRVKFNGEWVADSTAAHLLFETRHLPVYYFPRADVRMDKLAPTDHHTFCPYKGTASYWTIRVGDKVSENAVWGYPDPYDEVPALKDFVAFYWDRVDGWYEEDEEIFVHPRDPYKRIDVTPSSRFPPAASQSTPASDSRRPRCARLSRAGSAAYAETRNDTTGTRQSRSGLRRMQPCARASTVRSTKKGAS